jgi:hypothetical protein
MEKSQFVLLEAGTAAPTGHADGMVPAILSTCAVADQPVRCHHPRVRLVKMSSVFGVPIGQALAVRRGSCAAQAAPKPEHLEMHHPPPLPSPWAPTTSFLLNQQDSPSWEVKAPLPPDPQPSRSLRSPPFQEAVAGHQHGPLCVTVFILCVTTVTWWAIGGRCPRRAWRAPLFSPDGMRPDPAVCACCWTWCVCHCAAVARSSVRAWAA